MKETVASFVCIECGKRQEKIIKQLQADNYCLEECKECQRPADKFVEYESNLKILYVILCRKQIYRHLFFNQESRPYCIRRCLLYSLFLLTMAYWYENRNAYNYKLDTVTPTHGNYIPGIGPEHRDMHLLQS